MCVFALIKTKTSIDRCQRQQQNQKVTMTILSKYSGAFGQPGEGAHSLRVFNVAVVDVLVTVLVAWIIFKLLKGSIHFLFILLSLFLAGIFVHWLFGVKTTVNKAVGL